MNTPSSDASCVRLDFAFSHFHAASAFVTLMTLAYAFSRVIFGHAIDAMFFCVFRYSPLMPL